MGLGSLLGSTGGEETGGDRSWRGWVVASALGVIGLGIPLHDYFTDDPPQQATSRPVNYNGVSHRPIKAEEERGQKPQAEAERPQKERVAPAREKKESEESVMRRKIRLLAHYSHPTVVGVGRDGRAMAQQKGQGAQRGRPDLDMPQEPNPRQMLEVPRARQTGYRNGDSEERGNVWTRDFYERGDRQTGVLRRARSPFVVQRGWKIPVRLDDPINTDYEGEVTATVIQDVKDSATGRHTLIPAGSWIVGGYDNSVRYGQDRIPTAWHRLNLPNGSKIDLNAMPGVDREGVAGLPADVDNHLWSTAGRAALLTITGATADLARMGGRGGSMGLDDALRREGGRELDRGSRRTFDRSLYRQPTLRNEDRPVFFVRVTEDIILDHEYRESSDYVEME